MKRFSILLFAFFLGLLLWAERSIIFYLGNDEKESVKISDVDTVRFKDGKILVEGKNKKSYDISDVDSATFDLGSKDTVFITYNNNSVVVDNPFGADAIETNTKDAHVTLVSHVGKKGVVYYLSGSSSDGVFELTPDKSFTLVFDNLSLSGQQSPIVLNKGLNDESYAATVHLRGKSELSDGTENNLKSAIYTKSKLKISQDSSAREGELTIRGNKQHAINSSKKIEIYSGTVIIDQAEGDGINADGLEFYGGKLSIKDTKGDGIDCSEWIFIQDGELSFNVSSDDKKGLKCDSIIEIKGGNINVEVTGKGSKALKAKKKVQFIGGDLSVSLDAKEPFVGTDNDYGYNAAIACDGDIWIGDSGKLQVKGSGIAAKGINCDANVTISGGTCTIDLTGTHYDETANKDTVSCMGIKCDGNVTISGGKQTIKIGVDAKLAKGIKADGDLTITDGELTIDVKGGYFITKDGGSGGQSQGGWNPGGWNQGGWNWNMGGSSKPDYEYATSKAIKVEGDVTITGGDNKLSASSGKGLICDGTITLGRENGSINDFVLSISAGSRDGEKYVIPGNTIEMERTKYHGYPKGIRSGKSIVINSGTIDIYAFDTGILSPEIKINGGDIEVDAPYDQGVFGKEKLEIVGGDLRVLSSYEALSGAIIRLGGDSKTYVVADDDAWNATDGNESSKSVHIYVEGGLHYAQCMGDGLDSNGDMIVSGGITVVAQSHSLNSPLDTDTGWKHQGGFVFAVGGNGMFNESIPVESKGHIYSSDISLSKDQYILVANDAGQVLAVIKMPLDPLTSNRKSGAVCAYNSDVKNYKFYVGNNFSGPMEYFDGRFGMYTPAQNFSINGFTSYQVSTQTGNGSAFGGGGGGGFQW
jgi:hypothetical protein